MAYAKAPELPPVTMAEGEHIRQTHPTPSTADVANHPLGRLPMGLGGDTPTTKGYADDGRPQLNAATNFPELRAAFLSLRALNLRTGVTCLPRHGQSSRSRLHQEGRHQIPHTQRSDATDRFPQEPAEAGTSQQATCQESKM